MRATRNYYEILGLQRDVAAAQIKRKYRQLARKYHPDVAQDKVTAHRLFIQINEAYEVLIDPVRRRAYDEGLDLQARREAEASAPPPPSRGESAVPGVANVSQLIKEAQLAFIQRKFNTAATTLKEALILDGANPALYAMLGDVYRAQGKVNSAVKYYSYALQYNPRDKETEKKLTNLIDKRVVVEQKAAQSVTNPQRTLILSMIWWGLVFLLIMLISVYPGTPIPWLRIYIPQISKWSWNLVGLIAGASAVAGMILSLTGLLSHPDDELALESSGAHWSVVPAGFFLLIGSGFFFLGAAGFYILVGLLQGELSRSMMILFGCVVAVVLISALMYLPEARYSVLMFGGNVAFFGCLIGWYMGAMVKPLSD